MLHRKHITVSILITLSLFLSVYLFQLSVPTINAVPVQAYHSSIYINGNSELDAFCSGNGTSGNSTHPYVISNFEITFDGPQNGIKIENIDRYLVFQNVNVSDYYQSSNSRGMYFINVSHLTIDACHSYNNSYGIVFQNVNFSSIIDTSASINKENGIIFNQCHNNSMYNVAVFENGLKENKGNGMNLISSNYNVIDYCLFIENQGDGLLLQESFHNEVFDTQFLLNKGECYIIQNDPEKTNNFHDNICKKRSIPGIPVSILFIISIATVISLVIITRRTEKKTQTS
jgi:hypothetical protein